MLECTALPETKSPESLKKSRTQGAIFVSPKEVYGFVFRYP